MTFFHVDYQNSVAVVDYSNYEVLAVDYLNSDAMVDSQNCYVVSQKNLPDCQQNPIDLKNKHMKILNIYKIKIWQVVTCNLLTVYFKWSSAISESVAVQKDFRKATSFSLFPLLKENLAIFDIQLHTAIKLGCWYGCFTGVVSCLYCRPFTRSTILLLRNRLRLGSYGSIFLIFLFCCTWLTRILMVFGGDVSTSSTKF